MSVEEDNRQEWTFTLYDFDNNGKVTREVHLIVRSKTMVKNELTYCIKENKDQSKTLLVAI